MNKLETIIVRISGFVLLLVSIFFYACASILDVDAILCTFSWFFYIMFTISGLAGVWFINFDYNDNYLLVMWE